MLLKNIRKKGLTHIYFDEKINKYSNFALGFLARSLGHNLKIAYFNSKKECFNLFLFFEKNNLEFQKNIEFFNFDSYNTNYFKENKFDLIIIDNCNFWKFPKRNILKLLENKNSNTEIIFICDTGFHFDSIKDNFDFVISYKIKENDFLKNKNLSLVYSNKKCGSIYCFGEVFKKIINKKQVKLIAFNKGEIIYGEKIFFKKVINILDNQKSKINLKILYFGKNKIKNGKFENKIEDIDFVETKKAIKEIEDFSEEKNLILDELTSSLKNNLINENQIIKTLNSKKNQNILCSGLRPSINLEKIFYNIIQINCQKYNVEKEPILREGIDF